MALVREPRARRGRTLFVGDSLAGWRLLEVDRNSAVFEYDGVASRLSFLDAAAQPPSEPTPNAETRPMSPRRRALNAPAADAAEKPKTEETDGEVWARRRFDRATIEKRLMKEMPVLLAQTGLTPRVEDGVIRGLRLTRIPDGTILSESGLLPGDVLLSVDDERVTGLNSLMGLLAGLQSAAQVRVVVGRGAETVRILYEFQ